MQEVSAFYVTPQRQPTQRVCCFARTRPRMEGTEGEERVSTSTSLLARDSLLMWLWWQAPSSDFPTQTSIPAIRVDATTPASPDRVTSRFYHGLEVADTYHQARPVSDPVPLPVSARLGIKKRVVFAEPLYSPPSAKPKVEMNPQDSSNINEDFDFSERENRYKATRLSGIQRKLEKKKSSILSRQSSAPTVLHRRSTSSATMAQTTEGLERTASASSNNDSIRQIGQRLDAILGPPSPRTSISQQVSPTASVHSATISATSPAATNPLPNTPISALPDDRSALETLINIHLGRLDRYRRQVLSFNTTIASLVDDYESLTTGPLAQAVPQLVTALEMEIEETRAGRDSKRRYVDFHRGELRVIAEKRLALDEASGVPPTLPAVFEGLESEEVWNERFW